MLAAILITIKIVEQVCDGLQLCHQRARTTHVNDVLTFCWLFIRITARQDAA